MIKGMTLIYVLINPFDNQIKYVGKSDNPTGRLNEHIRKSKYISTYKNNWLKYVVKKNKLPKLVVVDEVLKTEWSFWEKHWISLIKSWRFELTNLTEGGDGGNFIKEWLGTKLASTTLNINKNTIRMVRQQKRKTDGGFKWKYK